MRLHITPTQWAATAELTPAEIATHVPSTLRSMMLGEAVAEAARAGHTPNGGGNFWLVPKGDTWLAIAIVPIVNGQS